MPIYEEKLISPLSVRFTQEHIRTTFRDGRELEESLAAICAEPGQGEYDLVLRAPFPDIEIVRWCPRGSDEEDVASAPDGGHWFTRDNRRLYCLQRAAVALWPKTVAAVVEILYADPGNTKRKYDSATRGRSVSLSHSLKATAIKRWDWRISVRRPGAVEGFVSVAELAVLKAIARDDSKTSVDALENAPRAAGSLMGPEGPAPVPVPVEAHCAIGPLVCPTPSTNAGSEVSDSGSAAESPRQSAAATRAAAAKRPARPGTGATSRTPAGLADQLSGLWLGGMGETYKLTFRGKNSWTVHREDAAGLKRYTVTYDPDTGLVWWGTTRSLFLDPAELADGGKVRWYRGDNALARSVRIVWRRCSPNAADVVQGEVAQEKGKDKSGSAACVQSPAHVQSGGAASRHGGGAGGCGVHYKGASSRGARWTERVRQAA
mmetsp:Transcript_8935/g.19696  ORF Transcript_8935/g.19696 Transcript_8935/m.19696 type:complete len:433 (-) Transcript_8935:233-1531(-)